MESVKFFILAVFSVLVLFFGVTAILTVLYMVVMLFCGLFSLPKCPKGEGGSLRYTKNVDKPDILWYH